MSKDEKQICMYCRAWQWDGRKDIPEAMFGDCRLRGPVVVSEERALDRVMVFKSVWPKTCATSWCLQFGERRDDHVTELPDTWQHISEPVAEVIRKSGEAYARNSKGEAA